MKKFLARRAASSVGGSLAKHRLVFVLAVASLAFAGAAVAPSASAGTVSLVDGNLRYLAAAGEANMVVVRDHESEDARLTYTVTETGAPLVVGPGCVSVNPTTASCGPVSEWALVEVSLGDLEDIADVWANRRSGIIIDGGTGNDDLAGGDLEGEAAIRGGAGDDVLRGTFLSGGAGDDVLSGCRVCENNRLFGGPGSDEVRAGADVENVVDGGGGDDFLVGSENADRLLGAGGSDRIFGRGGGDVVTGGRGRDELRGGPGRDTLHARDGDRDRLDGGSGRDRARIDRGLDRRESIERLF